MPLSDAQAGYKRQKTNVLDIPFPHKKTIFFTVKRIYQILGQHFHTTCGVYVFGDTQNLTDVVPMYLLPDAADPAWAERVESPWSTEVSKGEVEKKLDSNKKNKQGS